jgi:hypothetical protein
MNLKSVVARAVKVVGGDVRLSGAAWSDGTPLRTVEVRIDDGPWSPAKLTPHKDTPFAWTFWTFDWKSPSAGEHSVAARVTDARGKVQPAPDDPFITLKKTYWEANQFAIRKIKIQG